MTELQFALRGIWRAPAISAAVVLTIALGVGATTTVISVVYRVLYRPLPYPGAERLVVIWNTSVPDPGAADQAVETRAASSSRGMRRLQWPYWSRQSDSNRRPADYESRSGASAGIPPRSSTPRIGV